MTPENKRLASNHQSYTHGFVSVPSKKTTGVDLGILWVTWQWLPVEQE